MATQSPTTIDGVTAPTGGFQEGGWYSGRQFTGGKLGAPNVITQPGVGQGQQVSSEVLAAGSKLQTPSDPKGLESYFADYQNRIKKAVKGVDTSAAGSDRIIGGAVIGERPTPPSMADTYGKLAGQYNVTGLQSQLTDLQSQRDKIQQSVRTAQAATESQPGVTADVVAGRESEQVRQANLQLDDVSLQINTLTNQLNNANSTISMVMQFTQQDYTNAANSYDTQFSQAMQYQQLINTEKSQAENTAMAHWSAITSLITSGEINMSNLTPDQKAQITSFETQAGLPKGITDQITSGYAQGVNKQDLTLAEKAPQKVVTSPATKIAGITVPFMGEQAVYRIYDPINHKYLNMPTLDEATSKQADLIQQARTPGLQVLGVGPNNQLVTKDPASGNIAVKNASDYAAPQVPSLLGSIYNLTLKPIIDGATTYAQLLGTAAGTATELGLQAIDPQQKYTAGVQKALIDALMPTVAEKYSNPVQAMTNGVMQTLAGEAAVLQVYYGATVGIARLAGINLMFNSGLFGTGGALQAGRTGGDPGQAFIQGALGYQTTGPFVGAFGDNQTTRFADTMTSLIAPVLAGHIANNLDIKFPGIESADAVKNRIAGLGEDVKGRLATGLAAPDPDNVTRSEKLMGDAVQITKAGTIRGMAKELEALPSKVGPNIDSYIKLMDGEMKPINTSEFLYGNAETGLRESGLSHELTSTPTGDQYPAVADRVTSKVEDKIKVAGENNTSYEALNQARKDINAGIPKSWFKDGMQVTNETQARYWLEWQASQYIKDSLSSADGTSYLQRAISMEHTAMSTAPYLADQALQQPGTPGSIYRAISKIIIQPIKFALEPIRIAAARLAQGPPSELSKSILKGEAPAAPEGTPIAPETPKPVTRMVTAERPPVKPSAPEEPRTLYKDPETGKFSPDKPKTAGEPPAMLKKDPKTGKFMPLGNKETPMNPNSLMGLAEKARNAGSLTEFVNEEYRSVPAGEKISKSEQDYISSKGISYITKDTPPHGTLPVDSPLLVPTEDSSLVDRAQVNKIKEDIANGKKVAPIAVSYVKGPDKEYFYLVMDGQHRLTAMEEAGVKTIPFVFAHKADLSTFYNQVTKATR